MFNKYYEDELACLRELGAEFARANPAAAPFLAERGSDPDVERILEGFAFLAGRLRQKLDDEMLELTQSLMQMLWPHYLRPLPSMAILQFEPLPHVVRDVQRIAKGTEIDSEPVQGTACRFRTTSPVDLAPVAVDGAELVRAPGSPAEIVLKLRLHEGVRASRLALERLRLYLHGEPAAAYAAYLHLTRRLRSVELRAEGASGGTVSTALQRDRVRAAGFSADDALLPYPRHAFSGYRLLQEYFALPNKFLFLDIDGIGPFLSEEPAGKIEIRFVLEGEPDEALRVTKDLFRLHCVPVVNLFRMESDPIRIEHHRVDYLLRPSGVNPDHHQVFSVDRVTGWVRGTAEPREYPSFFSFAHDRGSDRKGVIYYQARLQESVRAGGVDTFLAFVTAEQESALPPTETAVAELTCTNRTITSQLRVGDLSRGTGSSPEFAKFRNITPVTPTVSPPLGGGLHWRLISNLSLNYLSLTQVEALRGILGVYNFHALQDRQAAREHELRLKGILESKPVSEHRLIGGAPVRGTRVEVRMKEENFAGEGEMVLFGSVLNEFLSLYCTLNSFTRLLVRGDRHGEEYSWEPRIGEQNLV